MLNKFYAIAFFLFMMAFMGCQWKLASHDNDNLGQEFIIERYDVIERQFLTTGDFAALQELKTLYPTETRTLIEDVLCLGQVNEDDINSRFLMYFQDSTLQTIIHDVDLEFANLDDISQNLGKAFGHLQKLLPNLVIPKVYTQIGSLNQSIIISDGLLGISLDKYLGQDYPSYIKFDYSKQQREMMTRDAIIPDCIGFYLLSVYPNANKTVVQWTINHCMGKKVYDNPEIEQFDNFVKTAKKFKLESAL